MNNSLPKIKITFAETIAIIKERNLEIIDLKARIVELEREKKLFWGKKSDIPDFLKEFAK